MNFTLSETLKTGFLASRPMYFIVIVVIIKCIKPKYSNRQELKTVWTQIRLLLNLGAVWPGSTLLAILSQEFNSLPTGYFFMFFLLSADFFSKSTFSKKTFRNTIRISNSLNPDQARNFVWPDLVSNCLQKLLADDTSRQRVKHPIRSKWRSRSPIEQFDLGTHPLS